MPLVKLTKNIIDSAKHPAQGQIFLRDTDIPGLALRITKGSKTFVMEKRIDGQMFRWSLGPFGALTLYDARKKAHEEIGQILKGENPAKTRKDKLHASTFGELTDLYIQNHLPRKRSQQNDLSMIRTHLAGWRNRKLPTIKRVDVVMLHSQIGHATPYVANRLVALVRKMFNLAKMWGLSSGDNPATGIDWFPERKRERFVQTYELPKVFNAIAQEPNLYVRAAFLLSLYTGARRNEVLSLKWADLSLNGVHSTWTIPQTKNNRPHTLPLSDPAVSLLKGIPQLEGNPYVFPGHKGTGHLVNLSKPWKRIRERAEIPDVRIHDLRRTVGSMLKASGEDLTLIAKVLNHQELSTTAIYARLNLDPVRKALDTHAQALEQLGAKNILTIQH